MHDYDVSLVTSIAKYATPNSPHKSKSQSLARSVPPILAFSKVPVAKKITKNHLFARMIGDMPSMNSNKSESRLSQVLACFVRPICPPALVAQY